MPQLNVILSPIAVQKFYDALCCLVKFNDQVVFEARRTKLLLSAFNSTKSAYGAVSLHSSKFFESYLFVAERGVQTSGDDGKFVCQFHIKALLPIFRSRFSDSKSNETSIEKCEMIIKDNHDKASCRLVIKLYCKNGVLKTYRLQYEEVQAMHAIFHTDAATSRWKIGSKLLKEYMDHFGPKADHLDIFSGDGRVSFTSFTEKLVNGNEILKHPLQTSVTLDTQEFDLFEVEDQLHVAINVKDFRAIVQHADSLNVTISAVYSENGKPMQITYDREGLAGEFTLMSRRKDSDNPTPASTGVRGSQQAQSRILTTNAPTPSNGSVGSASGTRVQVLERITAAAAVPRSAESMPPPPSRMVGSTAGSAMRPSQSQRLREESPPLRQSRSFFIGQDDEDLFGSDEGAKQQEDVDEHDGAPEHETLMWDPTAPGSKTSDFEREGTASSERQSMTAEQESGPVIPPTQRPSQRWKGVFD